MMILLRILATIYMSIHFVVFIGLTLSGALAFRTSVGEFTMDILYNFGLVILGVVFGIVLIQMTYPYMKRTGAQHALQFFKGNKWLIVITLTIVAIQIVIRNLVELPWILYWGQLAGAFIFDLARAAYIEAFRFDIYDYGFYHLTWLGQIYIVYVIAFLISLIINKFSKKKSTSTN